MSKKQVIERVNDLNSHQWRLYEWLTNQNKLVSLKTIYREFDNYYPDFKKEKCSWNNSSARRQITEDLNVIANSKCLYRVLVRSVNGVGFLPKDETERYLKSEEIRLAKEWETLSYQKKKAGLDNQSRITFGIEKSVIESFAKVGVVNG